MVAAIFTDKEIKFLRALVAQRVPFIVVGLSAATLQGAPVVTQDVDLWFERLDHPGIAKALKQCGGTYIPPINLHPPMFVGNSLELFDIVVHMHGLGSFADESNNTIDIPLGATTVKALKLDRIIASKEALQRPKDQLVLPVLRDTLITLQTREERPRKR